MKKEYINEASWSKIYCFLQTQKNVYSKNKMMTNVILQQFFGCFLKSNAEELEDRLV